MYNTICKIDGQSRFDAWDRALRASALGQPWGMGWGGRWEGSSRWGTHVHPWLIHVNVWQKALKYCKVTCLQLKQIYTHTHRKEGMGKKKRSLCFLALCLMPSKILFLVCLVWLFSGKINSNCDSILDGSAGVSNEYFKEC